MDVQSKRLATLATKNKIQHKVQPAEFKIVLKVLKKHYPDAHCALNFTNPFELLIATILSAQCTDVRVNIVTVDLFKKFPTPKKMSEAPTDEIEALIRSAGFYKNKAKNIKACAEVLVTKYMGEVPKTLEELYALPGVGRKTANVVLGNAFGIASGVVVDTHVCRLTNRFGWAYTQDAVRIENILNEMVPQKEWIMLPHYLISHGRSICKARSPQCSICFLNSACPKLGV
ncbi:MAG: endonuclease III [Bdellovibrionaceae bacterium]|nr:endonuclease III [Bdellovibrio sp.]